MYWLLGCFHEVRLRFAMFGGWPIAHNYGVLTEALG